jgi:hypothetical protein
MLRVAVLASLWLATTAGASPALMIYESRRASAVTEGDVTIATDPETAYSTAVDYRQWARIFPNVRQAVVTSQRGDEADVTFIHDDGTRDRVHFRNRPCSHTVWFEQLGGDADVWAEITFTPAGRNRTHVHSRLYADVHGLASLMVSDREMRGLRQQQVREDLVHLQRFFAARRPRSS